jgi:hypothetical protein
MPQNHEIKIPIATMSTLRTLISATMTGSPSLTFAGLTSKYRTRTQKTIPQACTQMTTHTLVWAMQIFLHINKSPNSRQFLDCSWERMLLMLGTSLHTPYTITTSTVSTYAIFVLVSSHSRYNSKDILRFAHFFILLEIRSIVMKKIMLPYLK